MALYPFKFKFKTSNSVRLIDRELRFQHGTGPCNVFILDTSSSLGEEGFTQMKEAFTSIIDGDVFKICFTQKKFQN